MTQGRATGVLAYWQALLRRRETWLFAMLLISYGYFFPRWAMWGANTKLNLAMAIVDRGTLSIEEYYQGAGYTKDYALYKGVHYSDKAPGTSFLSVPFYAAFKSIAGMPPLDKIMNRLGDNPALQATLREGGSGLRQDKVYFAMAMAFVTFFVAALPSAILGVVIYRFLEHLDPRPHPRILITLVYGLGTLAFAASQTLDRQIVAVLTFSAFYVLFLIGRGQLGWKWLLLAGFLMGWSAITDYPTALILGGLFCYALFVVKDKTHLLALVIGGAPPALLAMAYNYACFDTPLPVGYLYSEAYMDLHSQGFISITHPHLDALWGLTFSAFRGLFYRSPFLLLALPGFWLMWRDRSWRGEAATCLWAVVSFFAFNSSSVMWWGGDRVGPTYLLPMLPYMTPPIACFLRRYFDTWWHRLSTGTLALWSWALTWIETLGGQRFASRSCQNPIWEWAWPEMTRGNIARNWGMLLKLRGWASLLPLSLLIAPCVWAMLRPRHAPDAEGRRA